MFSAKLQPFCAGVKVLSPVFASSFSDISVSHWNSSFILRDAECQKKVFNLSDSSDLVNIETTWLGVQS